MYFEKNLWKFKQILKILFKFLKVLTIFLKVFKKFWKFLKIFESFKENVNKNLEKLNENYNFLLLSIFIAGRGLGCSPSFANFPGFRGGGNLPPPGYSTDAHGYKLSVAVSEYRGFSMESFRGFLPDIFRM